jgi:hypothetical protein
MAKQPLAKRPVAKRLLHRQARLLEYLTSGDAIFGDGRDVHFDAALQGIDRALLHIEARFSHEKRMEKIAAVFPKTFALLGADRDAIMREFVEACPPVDISRIESALQFRDFLTARWQRQPPAACYLPDVTACELALAQVRIDGDGELTVNAVRTQAGLPGIRRKPGVVLLSARFDIRPIFEGGSEGANLIERKVPLAIAHHAGEPRIFELAPEVFDLLAALDRWVAVDEFPDSDGLIADLTEAGLLEVRR